MTEEAENPKEEEQTEDTAGQAAAEPVETRAEAAPAVDAGEVEEGKVFAVLSYALSLVGLPFFLVPLIMRNNEFALYHAKQSLILWLAGIAAAVISMILSFLCIGLIIGPIAGVFLLVLDIIGLVNAGKGEAKPVPVIGQWGVDWFKGIKKVQA